MHRDDYLRYMLSGTITFPPTQPKLATLSLEEMPPGSLQHGARGSAVFMAIREEISPRVLITRRVHVKDVRAVYLPQAGGAAKGSSGVWLVGDEVLNGLTMHTRGGNCIRGVVYVLEQAPTLLEMKAGLPAAESAQYYPPLPVDRSVNHYDPYRRAGSPSVLGGSYYCEPDYALYCEPLASTYCELMDSMYCEPMDAMYCEPFDWAYCEPMDAMFCEPMDWAYCEPFDAMAETYQQLDHFLNRKMELTDSSYMPVGFCEPFAPTPFPPLDDKPNEP